jgi:hypothetical protein
LLFQTEISITSKRHGWIIISLQYKLANETVSSTILRKLPKNDHSCVDKK